MRRGASLLSPPFPLLSPSPCSHSLLSHTSCSSLPRASQHQRFSSSLCSASTFNYTTLFSVSLSHSQPIAFQQKRFKSKKSLLLEKKKRDRLQTKYAPRIPTKVIPKTAKEVEQEGWVPAIDLPEPKQKDPPSVYTPPQPKEDESNHREVMEALETMGFFTKLKDVKESQDSLWGKAFVHRFYENKVTHPANREYYLKGIQVLEAATREYLFHKYPNLPPVVMSAACKWFTSPVATARFAKFLKFDELLSFYFVTPIAAESNFEAYKQLEPAERVSVLGTSYTSLVGIIYEQGGIEAVLPLVELQAKWLEGLKITFISEKEPLSKTQERKQKLAKSLKSPFSQTPVNTPNWIANSFTPLFTPKRTPKAVAAYYLERFGYSSPTYNVLRESGRLSPSAVYLVGVFKGDGTFIAQGFGDSIKLAEHEAAKNALQLIFSKPNTNYKIPPINYIK